MSVKKGRPRRLWRITNRLGWGMVKHDNRLTGRVHHLLIRRTPWWDWGHPLMILVGTNVGGNYKAPEPPTWWYRLGDPKPMWRTKYPRHPLSTVEIITEYAAFRAATDGLNEDEMYEWQAIGPSQDGGLHLGHQYWGGRFYELSDVDQAVLRRYLRHWRRREWFGLRSWLYAQALHAALHRRKPFTCQATPPRGSGGYSHWRCGLPRRHDGLHRVNSYVWGNIDGEPIGATFVPERAES